MSEGLLRQLEQIAQGGWDGIDDPNGVLKVAREEQSRIEREERQRQVKIFHDCFRTEAGQRCLALLRLKTIDRPPTAEELATTSAEAFALMQARRMGAANLVFMIEAALAEAKGQEQKEAGDAA